MSFPRKNPSKGCRAKLRGKTKKTARGVCCQLLRLSGNFQDVASALEIQDVSNLCIFMRRAKLAPNWQHVGTPSIPQRFQHCERGCRHCVVQSLIL